jgi:hypothetical protein
MPPKYLCFISYASPNRDFVYDLEEALGKELERYVRGKEILDNGIFIDNNRIHGGDFPDEAIRQAICKSVCMIMVYTPSYFNEDYTYCTREFKGMEHLEEHRLSILTDPELKTHGLIIPVVFRGRDYLPEEIKKIRCQYDFSNYYSCYKRISKHPTYARAITELAQYIHNIYLI